MTTETHRKTSPICAPTVDAFRNLEDNGTHPYRARIHIKDTWLFVRTREGLPARYPTLLAACEAGQAAYAKATLMGAPKG